MFAVVIMVEIGKRQSLLEFLTQLRVGVVLKIHFEILLTPFDSQLSHRRHADQYGILVGGIHVFIIFKSIIPLAAVNIGQELLS